MNSDEKSTGRPPLVDGPPAAADRPPAEPGVSDDGAERVRSYYTDYFVDDEGKLRYVERLVIEEEPGAPVRGWLARFWPPLALALAVGVGTALWGWQRPDEAAPQAQDYEKDTGQAEAQMREILQPRQIGEDPTQRQLPAELVGKAKFLLAHGDEEQNALAKIILKNDEGADLLINTIKQEPVAKLFRLLTLEAHNWYNVGEFDNAVKLYEQALMLRPDDPDALRNAAVAHSHAKGGDAAAHWRRAIELLEQAVGQVSGGSAQWCELQNNLGLAWSESQAGDPGDNLRRAVAVFRAAQGKLACDGDQLLWAAMQNNLGAAWLKMGGGDQANNLRNAVEAFHRALEVYTRKENPQEWAMAQNNIGEAWLAQASQPGGNPGEGLAHAAASFRLAAEATDRDEHPLEWAKIQNNIGLALDRAPTGNLAENRRQAIAAFQAAEKIYSRPLHPAEWAANRFNQAQALKHLADAEGKGCDRLWQATAYLKAAAGVWTPEAFPISHQSQVAPLEQAVREAWRARGCGPEKLLEEIPEAK